MTDHLIELLIDQRKAFSKALPQLSALGERRQVMIPLARRLKGSSDSG